MSHLNNPGPRSILLLKDFRKPKLFIAASYGHPAKNLADHRVSALLNYLSNLKPTEVPDVTSLAASLNLSPSYLRFIFKVHTGTTISRYIKHLRLEQAHQMLQGSLLSVKQVMALVGLDDHSHFTRDYKRQFGESPSKTRLRLAQTKAALALSRHKIVNLATNKNLPDVSIANILDKN